VCKVEYVGHCRPKYNVYSTGTFSVEYRRDLKIVVKDLSRSVKMAPIDRS